jgi:IclR family acetate operon transcriptional repressor
VAAAERPPGSNTAPGDAVDRSGSVQVLDKAGRVLDCFSEENSALRISDLRAMTGLPATTCSRIVRTLVEQDLLQRDGDLYRIGLRVLVWGAAATAGSVLLAAAGPLIRRLRDSTGETTAVFVRQGPQRVVVDIAESRHSIIFRGYVGEAMPLGAGAAGKVFMAWDRAALDRTREDGIESYTSATITDGHQIDRQLSAGRELGYMYANQEREVGLSSVAAPVFGSGDRLVAAVSIGAPSFRLTDDLARHLGPDVAATATVLSRALGWTADTQHASAGDGPPARTSGRPN